MKALTSLLLVAVCLLALPACKTAQKYEQNRLAGDQWLSDKTRPASANISGNWYADDWGGGTLTQQGRNITGVLGQFDVKGVMSGSKVYLLISEGGWIYYTAVLDRTSAKRLNGFYSYTLPFSIRDQRSMEMQKL